MQKVRYVVCAKEGRQVNDKVPFPQFGDDAFESPSTFIQAVIAWDELGELDRPHAVITYDPEVKKFWVTGPFPNAFQANEEAVKTHADLNDPKNNDGAKIAVFIAEIQEPVMDRVDALAGTRLIGFRRPSTLRFMEKIMRDEIATGISSHALALHALGIQPMSRPLPDWGRPLDRGDYGRCMKTYHAAPRHLQRKMRWVLDDWGRMLREDANHKTSHYKYVEPNYHDGTEYEQW